MSSDGKVPDAWDDDWVIKADQSSTPTADPLPSSTKLSKAERRARQAEFNRQLWEDAEAPKDSYFLNSKGEVPLKSEFKPAMKVLSRKPISQSAGASGLSGLEQPTIDDDEDDEDSDKRKLGITMEERQQNAQREREEKQKKYEEARQRLFGSESSTGSRPPGNNVLPVAQQSGESRSRSKNKPVRDSRPSSSTGNKTRQLFDPNFTSKPDTIYAQKRENQLSPRCSTPTEQQPIRSPRGPENIGRGGFGFAARGDRAN